MIFKQIIINRLSFLILCLAFLVGIYFLSLDPSLKGIYFMVIAGLFALILYRLTLLQTKRIMIYLLIAALIAPLTLTFFDIDVVRHVFLGQYIPIENDVLVYALFGLVILAEIFIVCITLFAILKKIKN
jgi:hypothetical protein